MQGNWTSSGSYTRSLPGRRSALSALPDAAEHPLRHEEAHHLDRLDEPARPLGEIRVTLAHDEAGGAYCTLDENEGPCEVVGSRSIRAVETDSAAQHHVSPLFEGDDLQCHGTREVDLVADGADADLGHDDVRAVDVGADEVLEPVVRVEAAAILAPASRVREDVAVRRSQHLSARTSTLLRRPNRAGLRLVPAGAGGAGRVGRRLQQRPPSPARE